MASNTTKIKTLSSFMSLFCAALMICIPLWVLWFWNTFDQQIASLSWRTPSLLIDSQYISSGQIILAASLHLSTSLFFAYGLWRLRKLFILFQTGSFFSSKAVSHFHAFSFVIFISTLIKPVQTTLFSLILTMQNPAGQKAFVVNLGSQDLSMIFVSALLVTVAWVFREGRILSEENASFV